MSHKTPFDRSTSYWGTMRTSLIRAVVRLLIGGGLLAGCGYAGPQIDFNPRPADAPDFVVFGVSGHCLGGCPSSYNPEYLLSEGTLDVVMDALDGNGWTAQCQGYVSAASTPGSAWRAARPMLRPCPCVTIRRPMISVRQPASACGSSSVCCIHRCGRSSAMRDWGQPLAILPSTSLR